MGRGIVSGGLWGLVFSGFVLALVSQMTERRSPASVVPPEVQAAAPESRVVAVAPEVAVEPEVVVVPEEAVVPEAAAPEEMAAPEVAVVPEVVAAVVSEPTGSPTPPSAASVMPALEAPEAVVPTAPEVPARQEVVIETPDAPRALPAGEPEDAAVVAPPPPAPAVGEQAPVLSSVDGSGPAPVGPRSETAPETAVAPAPPVGPGPVVAAPTDTALTAPDPAADGLRAPFPEPAPEPAPGAITTPPSAPPAVAGEVALATPDPVSPTRTTAIAPELGAPVAADADPAAPGQEAGAPDPALPQEPEPGSGADALPGPQDAPAPEVSPQEPVVITDRLPRIGDAAESPAPVEPGDAVAEAPLAADALTRNGVPFDNAEGRPIVAIVLLDGMGEPVNLPFAVSVAIDAGAPEAGARAAAYRAAGVEVVLLPQIPEGAVASDVAVALEDTFLRIPDAVALLDSPEGVLQSDRDVLGQVLSELADTGHGLVMFPRGLNTAVQLAGRSGVTAGLVFRDIDGEGQDLKAIKRFLDQAAFRARQEDSVILIARDAPETIAALAEWALGNRAASVALVPVSAALKAAGG